MTDGITITGNRVGWFFKQFIVILLAVMMAFILPKNHADAGLKPDFVYLMECSAASDFSVDLGTDNLTGAFINRDITKCQKYSTEWLGCIFIRDLTEQRYEGRDPGRYLMKNANGQTLYYALKSNFSYTQGVRPLPDYMGGGAVTPNIDYPWKGHNTNDNGGQINLNLVSGMYQLTEQDLRTVPAGVYVGRVQMIVRIGSHWTPGQETCAIGDAYAKTVADIVIQTTFTVTKKCTIQSVASLDFGQHGNLNKDIQTNGSVDISCNSPSSDELVPFTLKFNNGKNPTSTGQRRMRSGDNYINYDVFYQKTNTPVGDVPGKLFSGSGSQRVGVIGRVQKQNGTIAGGKYTDTILLTLEY